MRPSSGRDRIRVFLNRFAPLWSYCLERKRGRSQRKRTRTDLELQNLVASFEQGWSRHRVRKVVARTEREVLDHVKGKVRWSTPAETDEINRRRLRGRQPGDYERDRLKVERIVGHNQRPQRKVTSRGRRSERQKANEATGSTGLGLTAPPYRDVALLVRKRLSEQLKEPWQAFRRRTTGQPFGGPVYSDAVGDLAKHATDALAELYRRSKVRGRRPPTTIRLAKKLTHLREKGSLKSHTAVADAVMDLSGWSALGGRARRGLLDKKARK